MKNWFVLVLFAVAAYCLGAAVIEKRQFAMNAAASSDTAFEAIHLRAEVHNDNLAIRNERLEIEIDRRQHHRNNGASLKPLEEKLASDEALSAAANSQAAQFRPEDTSGEMLEFILGGAALLGAIVLLCVIKPGQAVSAT